MGCDACYTNHADADQNELENLEVLLAAAGCNYFMGIPMGDDVMLNYQIVQLPRRRGAAPAARPAPAPEFEAWLEEHRTHAQRPADREGGRRLLLPEPVRGTG